MIDFLIKFDKIFVCFFFGSGLFYLSNERNLLSYLFFNVCYGLSLTLEILGLDVNFFLNFFICLGNDANIRFFITIYIIIYYIIYRCVNIFN